MELQQLVEKNRVMHHLLQKATTDALEFGYTAKQIQELVGCSVYILDKHGVILGQGDTDNMQLFSLSELKEKMVTEANMQWIFSYTHTESNMEQSGHYIMLAPIVNINERLGTIVFARTERKFALEEVMLAEYGAAVSAVQMMRTVNQKAENEARKKNVVQLALEVLSYSELEAVKYIFNEIEGSEGFLVASKLAEQYKLTRSVIVNALRKLESAGVIDARSLGMKGTYIKILNDYLYEELASI